ncbi:MAG: UDP-N-acetylglucosamine 2-epimerase (non-hydrolyzing), partial [Planctomycetes bacterium]|nr:UDP-N-acetylglucosamine 2-epimerase (non-hydrolyzing) [Planctomycetota bacterium]
MKTTKKILCVVGTRPEAIKMAPLILALKKCPWADLYVLATAQHRELLDQVLSVFEIVPDGDLDLMRHDQTLSELSANLLTALDGVLEAVKADLVVAQGDTTTVLMSAMASFYRHIPFAHVEAGLRTGDLNNPFPEEMNRIVADRIAVLNFAPTEAAGKNLLDEGIPADTIHVTGNTVIDALLDVAARGIPLGLSLDEDKKLVLVTAHRRESFGSPFEAICRAIKTLADRNPDLRILYPVHPNPNVGKPVQAILGDHPRIILAEPMEYGPFVTAMKRAHFILTDSGGIQEEAPALGKPVLVLREETERPEALTDGVVRLVGTDETRIVETAQRLLDDETFYASMAKGASPYGDGHAASRIVESIRKWFE